MKFNLLFLFLLAVLFTGCTENKGGQRLNLQDSIGRSIELPDTTVEQSLLRYNRKTSLWMLNMEPYSGYMVSFHQNNILKEKTGILNGKKYDQSTQWYPDGHIKQVANYSKGKLHGEKKRWSTDTSHILIAHLNYRLGKAHGEQTQWYPTGELYKKLNLNMGTEEGVQQAYRKNGELYANYEAKHGRIFGLRKAALCYGLEDENIRYEN